MDRKGQRRFVCSRTVSALMKKFAIARLIFLGVLLKVYLPGGCRCVTTHISISIILGVCLPGGTSYQEIFF